MIIEYARKKSYIRSVAAILAIILTVVANVNQDALRKLFPVTASAEINNSSYTVVFPLEDGSANESINKEATAGIDLMESEESELLFSVVSIEEDLDVSAEDYSLYNEEVAETENAEMTKLEIPQVYVVPVAKATKATKNTKAGIKLTEADLDLFERIVYCEAGAEDMVGMILIANVIINRVNSNKYPNNVTDVILQKGQFSPVGSGWVYRCTPSAQAKLAVQRALNGEDYSQGAIGFFNRRLAKKSTATWFDSALRFILKHGEVEYFGFK